MLSLCVLVHVWCSDDDGVCKNGSKVAVGCNVTLIGTDVVVVAGTCLAISWQHCPQSADNTARELGECAGEGNYIRRRL